MIISDKNKYVYVSTPKAGTHTFYHILTNDFDGKQVQGSYHQNKIPDCCAGYYTFTSVRHPFVRVVSIWHALLHRDNYRDIYMKHIGSDSFLDFALWLSKQNEDIRPRGKGGILLPTQSQWLDGIDFDKIIKLEEVDSDFNDLPFVNNKINKIPSILKREHEQWSDVCCDLSKDVLFNYYNNDFANFGYDPEGV